MRSHNLTVGVIRVTHLANIWYIVLTEAKNNGTQMPVSNTASSSVIELGIRRALGKIQNYDLTKVDTAPDVEKSLEALFRMPQFKQALLSGNRFAWFAASSLPAGHGLIFHCFCTWGMSVEKVLATVMALRPVCSVPKAWRRGYIKLLSNVAVYSWSPASLVMALSKIENKDDISSVGLRVLLKHMRLPKAQAELIMALRVYMPELNQNLENAMKSFLSEAKANELDLHHIPRELFAPYIKEAGDLRAVPCLQTRKILWDSDLSHDSRVSLGQTDIEWADCSLARELGWRTTKDVIAHINSAFQDLGPQKMKGYLSLRNASNALIRVAFHQAVLTLDQLPSSINGELAKLLLEGDYVKTQLDLVMEDHEAKLQAASTANSVENQKAAKSAL